MLLAGIMVLATLPCSAQEHAADSVAADSSNFVTASLLILSATNEVYSSFGHTVFRMECPSYNLDYVFTFETDSDIGGFATLFAGKAYAKFKAVKTTDFLETIRSEGRGIMQYELNLAHHEKQELWRHLDNDMVEGASRKFNLKNNCVTTAISKIHQSLINEYLEWSPWQGEMLMNNGDLIRHYVRSSPWAEFLFVSFLGTHYDEQDPQDIRLSPENIVENLSRASFVNTESGKRRPVIEGKGKEILSAIAPDKRVSITPGVVFGFLLLIVCILTIMEWTTRWKKPARWLDVILLTTQTLAGILLLMMVFTSDVFGYRWNWYLIPINPLPFLLWLCLHKLKGFGKIYIYYTVGLVAFIALTPFISQLDVSHQLITAAFAVRCVSNYMTYKRTKEI